MSKPKVMVAVSNPDSVESLVKLACLIAQGMEAEVQALHVVVVPLLTPLEASDDLLDHPGKELLAQAQAAARQCSARITTQLLRAREVQEAIVGVAKEQGVDVLVMGHHRPDVHALAETLLGGIVRYVAHHAPCRVIVQIPAPQHGGRG